MMHRIRLTASGSSISASLDGEPQISVTDISYSSGTILSFVNLGATGAVHLLHVRSGANVTVSGTQSGDVVTLRGPGGIPLVSKTAAGSSLSFGASDGLVHFPAYSVDLNGKDIYQGNFWGGDAMTLQTIQRRTSGSRAGSRYSY